MLDVGDRIGDWIVDRTLGEGGMGAVYLAHNVLSSKVRAAVKVLKPHELGDAKKRFVREVELVASVQHPAVVRVLGGGEDTERGLLYMAMEYLEGEELKDRLDRGPLSWEEACRLFMELGSGLLAAHRLGVVHRDIKPQNIWLCADGSGKLLDFGIAVQEGGTKLTRAGAVPGTVAYMPPEVFQGESPDHRADIYALGLVLWETLTGKEAFPEDPTTSQKQAIVQIMGQKLQSEPFDTGDVVPEAVRDMVRHATEPEPTVRLSDLQAFVEVLQNARNPNATYAFPQTSSVAPPKPLPPRASTTTSSTVRRTGVAVVGAGVLGGGAVLLFGAVVVVAALVAVIVVSQPGTSTTLSGPVVMAPAPVYTPPAGQVPDGFPFDVPDEARIITGMINESGTSKTYIVSFTVEQDHDDLVDKYTKALKDRKLTVTASRSTDANGVTDSIVGYSSKEQSVAIVAPPMAVFGEGAYVTLTFSPL